MGGGTPAICFLWGGLASWSPEPRDRPPSGPETGSREAREKQRGGRVRDSSLLTGSGANVQDEEVSARQAEQAVQPYAFPQLILFK